MKIFDFKKYGNAYKMKLEIDSYLNGNFAITMLVKKRGRLDTLECPYCKSRLPSGEKHCLH